MSEGSVFVTFGGDTSALEVATAQAAGYVRKYTAELASLGREAAKLGSGANDDVKQHMLEIAAALDKAKAIFAEGREAMKSHGEEAHETGEKLDELKDHFKELLEFGGIAFTADALKDWVEETTEAAEKIQRDAASVGVSLKEVQQISGEALLSGTDYQDLETNLERLQLRLAGVGDKAGPTSAALKALGIEIDELRGRPLAEQIEVMGEAFSKFADGPTKTAASMALLGRAGAEMIPIFDKGKEGIEEMQEALSRTSYVMSDETVNALAETRDHLNELEAAWTGMSRQILAVVNPAVDAAVVGFTHMIESVKPAELRADIADFVQGVVELTSEIAGFCVEAVADVEKVLAVARKLSEWAASEKTPTSSFASGGLGFYPSGNEAADRAAGSALAAMIPPLKEAGKSLADQFEEIDDRTKTQLESLKKTMAGFGETVGDKIRDGSAASPYGALSNPWAAPGSVKPQVPTLDLGGAARGATDTAAKDAEAELKDALATINAAYAETRDNLADLLSEHKIGMAKWAADTEAALDKEQDAAQDAFDKILADAAIASAKKVEIVAQETTKLKDIWREQAEANRKLVDEMQKQYEGVAGTISGAFTSQFDKILQGQESWSAAMKNIAKDLTLDLINESIKSTAKWLADQAAQAVAAQTKAAAVNAADASAGAGGLISQLGGALKAIETYAAEAFGGVFAFLAPVLGPAAAGPAAAASGAVMAAGSVASADIGMWSVPQDMLTLVHHNELIMPAGPAGALRSMLSGEGGAGGGNVSIHPTVNFGVQALDGGSVRDWMRNNSSDFLKHVDNAVREGAALGAKRLRTR